MIKVIPVIALSLLITACGGGLSAKEKRAAEAHANNLCLMAQDTDFPEAVSIFTGAADIAALDTSDPHARVLTEGTRIARERGCIS